MSPVEFTFELIRKHYISSNDVLHYKQRMARVNRMVAMGKRACEERGVAMDAAHLSVTVDWPDGRSRDTPNIWPTVKALEDGLVRGGLLPDDSDRFILSTLFVPSQERSGIKGVTRVRMTFTPAVNPG